MSTESPTPAPDKTASKPTPEYFPGQVLYEPEGFLRSALGDGEGNVSAFRVVFVLVAVIFAIAWAVVSIRAGALAPIPNGSALIFAILTGGKIIQNSQENGSQDSSAD